MEGSREAMEGSHGSSIWRVVWVVVVKGGLAAMEALYGEWCGWWSWKVVWQRLW